MPSLTEIRLTARRLLRDRGFAAAAVLIVGMGTGLNTAVFAVAYGVLVRPLPYREDSRLVLIDVAVPLSRVSEWREHLDVLEDLGAYAGGGFTVRGLGDPRYVPVAAVDEHFFDVLGTPALAGRALGPSDSGPVAVLSDRLARQTGISIAGLLGRGVTVGDVAATVIGVMPADFAFPSQGTAVWISARSAPVVSFDRADDARRFGLIGRLRPDVTVAHATANVVAARKELLTDFDAGPDAKPRVSPLKDAIIGPVQPVLVVFLASAAIVLLIASANVATILVGRTVRRRREFAIRAALGASRSRLLTTIFSESILVALAGAVVGTALAVAAVGAVGSWGAGIVPRLADIRVDGPVLAFTLVIAGLAAVAAAFPALRVIASDTIAEREGVGGTRAGVDMRRALAVAQIALAALLLSVGALLTRTLVGLLRADIGVEPRGAVVSQLLLGGSMRFDAIGKHAWMENLLQHVRAIPGTVAAGVGSSLPPDNAPIVITARFGVGANVTETPELSLVSVTPGYLEALGTGLREGRYFEQRDEQRGEFVVLLSQSAARALVGGANAVGAQLPIDLPGIRDRGRATVVGVVADVKYSGLESAPGPAIYVLWKELPASELFLALRTHGEALAAAPTLRAVLRDVDPTMPVMPIRRLDEVVQRSVAERRLRAFLGAGVAVLALAIALTGLAGGLTRMVTERRHELAVRAALGASPARMLRDVMAEGAIVSAVGIVLGTLATLVTGGVLQSMLFGIDSHDPATLGVVGLLVGVAALLVCYFPARRAAAANPSEVLRDN